jgi:hypothetical protein
MKLKSAIILWALVAIFVVVAGCTSFGGPGATTQAPATTVTSPGSTVQSSTPQAMPQSLTEAQKTQATNIVKADAAMKDVLNKPGYDIIGVNTGTEAGTAMVTIQGGNTQHADGSLWTPDQYTLIVDLNKNKITDTIHVEPKALPTPQPTT